MREYYVYILTNAARSVLYVEVTNNAEAAITREKQIKKWSREKKEALIDTMNMAREDLSASVEMTQ